MFMLNLPDQVSQFPDKGMIQDPLIEGSSLTAGISLVWFAKMKDANYIDRCYLPDVFEYILKQTATDENIKHYFSRGKESVAEELKRYCVRKYGNMNIVGTHCPPFRDLSEKEIE